MSWKILKNIHYSEESYKICKEAYHLVNINFSSLFTKFLEELKFITTRKKITKI